SIHRRHVRRDVVDGAGAHGLGVERDQRVEQSGDVLFAHWIEARERQPKIVAPLVQHRVEIRTKPFEAAGDVEQLALRTQKRRVTNEHEKIAIMSVMTATEPTTSTAPQTQTAPEPAPVETTAQFSAAQI